MVLSYLSTTCAINSLDGYWENALRFLRTTDASPTEFSSADTFKQSYQINRSLAPLCVHGNRRKHGSDWSHAEQNFTTICYIDHDRIYNLFKYNSLWYQPLDFPLTYWPLGPVQPVGETDWRLRQASSVTDTGWARRPGPTSPHGL